MAYQALYRQYRPKTFGDVVEQQHVVTTLKNIVQSGKTAHAYLFCGTRGTGKTTLAKIFARAVNCLHPINGDPCNECEICKGILNGTILDVVEIDAASNNSVDNVRSIIDEVVYAPAQTHKKVYIIDEVHMLSTGAFNALLKTLEEPPEHILFILATTEPHKLPATVLSRCQRFDFRRISIRGIAERLLCIAKESKVDLAEEAVHFIASLSEGALRDGISILDQCIATGKNPLDLEAVHEIIGIAPVRLILDTGSFLIDGDGKAAIRAIDQLISDGKDPGQYLQGLIQLFRDLLVYKTSNSLEPLFSVTEEEKEQIPVLSGKVSLMEALAIIRELTELEAGMKWSSSPRILLEITFLRICTREMDREGDTLSERINLLESRIRSLESGIPHGNPPTASGPANCVTREAVPEKIDAEPSGVQNRQKKKTGIAQTANCFNEWESVLEELKSIGRMQLFSSLTGIIAVWLDENSIGIILEEEESYLKLLLTKSENMQAITDAIQKSTGQSLQVKIICSEPAERQPAKADIPDKVLRFAENNGINLDIVE